MLLRDLMRDEVAGIDTLARAAPDVILLTDVDYDAGLIALKALNAKLPKPFPHQFAQRPNSGMPTGLDLDGDGLLGGPRDAQGFGWFSGQGGQAILSRWPLRLRSDMSQVLWRDVPETGMQPSDPGTDLQRLSSTAHWAVDVVAPFGTLTLLTVGATPPVFDGPEDRNGRRNRDEVLLWHHVLSGAFGETLDGPFVVLGNLNLDPDRGEGMRQAVSTLLNAPGLQDPLPSVPTVEWETVGKMRVSYVLPSIAFSVLDAGVIPPERNAGPHTLVWVDLILPTAPQP